MGLIEILGTGVAAGIVIFLLNAIRDAVVAFYRRKAKKRIECLTVSNALAALALDLKSKVDAIEQDSAAGGWENVSKVELPKVLLVGSIDDVRGYDPETLRLLADIELDQKRLQVEETYALFEANHLADTGYDLNEDRLNRVRSLLEQCVQLSIRFRRKAGLDSSVIQSIPDGAPK